jgi:hypothetical protein
MKRAGLIARVSPICVGAPFGAVSPIRIVSFWWPVSTSAS